MRILVTFAVDAEFAPWRDIRAFKKVRANPAHYSGGREVYETRIGECTVWVFLTGMGIKFFDFEAANCFVDARIAAVISCGLAGALREDLGMEQIVVPARVGNLRDANGLPVSLELAAIATAESLEAKSISSMLTADHIVATQQEKKRLSQFAEAVDMESFHVVSQFSGDNLPVAVIRVISDGSGEDLPIDFEKCITSEGRVKPGPLVGELLSRPAKLPGLIRFGRQSKNAAKRLAIFLDSYIATLTPEDLRHRPAEVEAP
jgi:adenosylhomocysteine nucleosidase